MSRRVTWLEARTLARSVAELRSRLWRSFILVHAQRGFHVAVDRPGISRFLPSRRARVLVDDLPGLAPNGDDGRVPSGNQKDHSRRDQVLERQREVFLR